ncbi:SusC/RagA family TonB-linked outer membrane protein [Aestuariibaculum sediminum]|uniref:SusC/RagA family TonB-linked outer membrane protein n=1 Tax=Aestuariibaculum sediminum TaxID=2770637 RepID=A0A8J6Q8W3_9FLAO|nr:SusC/RagA family TonB-linked outer membrane protein [Aestuariibaculum sediminum]MBD0833448.1 SusC/RagA family TonB-linked outer membrane protein [Aestuariibaculum sediminum]
MKRSLILCISFLSISAFSFSQKVSLKMGKVTLYEALKEIKNQTEVDFFYSDKEVNIDRVVSANFKNAELIDVLYTLLGNTYNVQKTTEGIILISPKNPAVFQNEIQVKGVVTDNSGMPLPGVTVLVKGTKYGTTTDFDGNYVLRVDETSTLVFSYIGYKTTEVPVEGRTEVNVQLEADVSELEEIVITGIVERKKESFTGATTTVKGEELKAIGNLNIIESLKTLDPSFVIVEDNLLGSNPNRLPNIEVRGKTSISTDDLRDEFGGNPNQPLFVLDGFETTLRTIIDLDMNRVASITILKDAASTALYGARAANGVIVVETKKPEEGKLQINYTSDFRVDMPDLSDYNLMNASQKLEYERLSGLWTASSEVQNLQQFELDAQYNEILKEINRGVDTYWLNEPVRVGTTLGHSVYAGGGAENVTYGIGLNYRSQDGVMKGSGRNTWGTNLDLTYRKGSLNISNRLRINGYDADESPYGSFSNFAQANPYFRKYDEDGEISRFLNIQDYWDGAAGRARIGNPLYNAMLNSRDNTENIQITNNLQAIWRVTDKLRLTSGFQISKISTTSEVFVAPEDTRFENKSYLESGTYNNNHAENFGYTFNTMATYATVLNEKHAITGNLRGSVEENSTSSLGVRAVGFPLGTNGNPAYSFSYAPNSKPSTGENTYRRVNLVASANYAYDKTYFFDLNYRIDGSTVFGSNEKYSPFWSVGAGWNLVNEFDLDKAVFSILRLRGSIGRTGNQGFGNLSDVSVYTFNTYINSFGQSVDLTTLANPDLRWQNTMDYSFGIETSFFKNRITAQINTYKKITDPLVVSIDLPSSTGVAAYPLNAGLMDTKGLEVIFRGSPIYNLKEGTVWTVGLNLAAVKSKYDNFRNVLQSLNDEALENQSLLRFRDGYSPDDLWAVESLGIDPATGEEVYLTANGEPTFEYNADDIKKVGNSRPTVEGVFTNNVRYKNFSLGINLRYRFGGDVFNRALFNKVENITRSGRINNQDVRALTDRWQNPGDVTQFKSISNFDNVGLSSRFIQEENVIIGESINIGYQFENQSWMDTIGLKRLKLNAYMNDIFRISSITAERGIDYPFARTVSFSLNANF